MANTNKKPQSEIAIIESLGAVPTFDLATVESSEFSTKYMLLLSTLEKLSAIKSLVDAEIKRNMEESYFQTGETTVASGMCKYTYVPETVRTTVDSAKLKAEFPDIYTKVVKQTSVKPALRTTLVKEGK